MRSIFLISSLLFIIYTVQCLPSSTTAPEEIYGDLNSRDPNIQNDDQINYYDENDEDDGNLDANPDQTDKQIKIKSKPETFIKNIGDKVVLPCLLEKPDDIINIWVKNHQMIFQDHTRSDGLPPNYQRLPDNSVQIVNITANDEGEYECRMIMGPTNQDFVTHQLMVNTPPTILDLTTQNNSTTLKEGDTLVLECKSTGYPKPLITWHKKNSRGEMQNLNVEGESLTIANFKKSEAGEYTCYADNKVLPLAHRTITIHIQQKPHISIKQYETSSDFGEQEQLECEFHGNPPPAVLWQKDGKNIHKEGEHIDIQRTENNIILVLKKMREEDFGNYTCYATNALGKTEKSVVVRKEPAHLDFNHEKNENDIVLTWTVQSKKQIIGHELQYRKKGTEEWNTVVPTVKQESNGIYTVEYTLKDVGSGVYETRARAENTVGWSPFSRINTINDGSARKHPHHKTHGKESQHKQKENEDTDKHSNKHESIKTAAVGPSSSNVFLSSASLLSISVIISFYLRQ